MPVPTATIADQIQKQLVQIPGLANSQVQSVHPVGGSPGANLKVFLVDTGFARQQPGERGLELCERNPKQD